MKYIYLFFHFHKDLTNGLYFYRAKKKKISKIEDLSKLPINLRIRKVCDLFMINYLPKNFRDSVVEPDLLLNDEYIKNLASDYSIDVSIPLEEQNDQMKKGLLKALISNFGIEFLCLGVLKFINDVLSFSGPLLLNLLVKFVETKSIINLFYIYIKYLLIISSGFKK